MPIRHRAWAGVLLVIGAAQFLVGLFAAEALFPGYNVGKNAVSDLGAWCAEGSSCVVQQPSATIFAAIMLVLGGLVLSAAFLLRREPEARPTAILLAVLGATVVGMGVFNESTGIVHAGLALTGFTAGPAAALYSARMLSSPLRYVALGLALLAFLGLAWQIAGTVDHALFGALGDGGVERVIVVPTLVWLLGFGGSLSAPGAPSTEQDVARRAVGAPPVARSWAR